MENLQPTERGALGSPEIAEELQDKNTNAGMDAISIEEIIGDRAQILREKEFREAVERFPWEDYRGREVLVRGCGKMVVPAWAYMVVAARLKGIADAVYFGDATSPVVVWIAEGCER